MLASLLPGLRQIRAPLAAGYLWLVAIWLGFAPLIPGAQESTGGLRALYGLEQVVGLTTALAAATFVAYLLGVLSVQVTAAILPMLRVLRRRSLVGFGITVAKTSVTGRAALKAAVLDELVQRSQIDDQLTVRLQRVRDTLGEPRPLDDPGVRRKLLEVLVDTDVYVAQLEADLPLLPLRLLAEGKQNETYGEFDRLRAEAEFRASVALPLVAVIAALGWRVSPWWLAALVLPAMLLVGALQGVTAAADLLAESIRARAAISPVLTALQTADLNERSADTWVQYAAEHDRYASAMSLYAEAFERRGEMMLAENWFRKAADNHEAAGMLGLFRVLYRTGQRKEALSWYQEALSAGNPDAAALAQQIAAFGSEPGIQDDLFAAASGDAAAMTRVGNYFAHRVSPQQANDSNLKEAQKWYRMAADAGSKPAALAMSEIYRSQGMLDAAADWAGRAANLDGPGGSNLPAWDVNAG